MQNAKRYAFCLLPFAFCIALYLLTLTDVHTYDALSYILDVDRKPLSELFHPHHLAYGPFGALIRGLAASLGWQGSAEKLLQAANAVAGALGVGLFGVVAGRSAGGVRAGAVGALLLGASYAYWYYAVEVEVYTIAAVFLVGALGLMLAIVARPSKRLAIWLGVVQGCAVLFHQTNVLLCVPALVALAVGARGQGTGDREGQKGQRALWVLVGAYTLPLAAIVGGAYLWVGVGVSGFRSLGELARWAAGYATTGLWGGAVRTSKLALLGAGLSNTLMRPGGAVVGLALLGILLARAKALAAAPRGLLVVAIAWLLVYGAFFFWWEPENIEFWIACLPPFYLLVALAVAGEDVGQSDPGRMPLARWLPMGAALTCGLVMLGVNFAAISRRGDAERDLQRVVASAMAERSAPGDLLIAADGLPELYLPFYEGRQNVFSLSQAMAMAGGDWPAACGLIRERAEGALAGGYGVLIADEAQRPGPAPAGEPPSPAERFGLGAEEVAACYAPFAPAMERVELGEGLGTASRIPGAQELADGAGWDFTRGTWGWRAARAEPGDSPQPGWALRPLADAAISSPPLLVDRSRFSRVEIRMANGTAARDAQLFLLGPEGEADEARSIRWELEPGAAMATYVLELEEAVGADEPIAGLRLDPVGVGDGGVVVVESIRLLP